MSIQSKHVSRTGKLRRHPVSRWLASVAWVVATLVMGCLLMGCRGGGVTRTVDDSIGRYARKGATSYAEGEMEGAIKAYRRAIRRAWAIDDAYESGTNAYNLAACMISANRPAEASDWLLDSRVELCRADASLGNNYLLEAKIALSESRLEDVHRLTNLAACSDAPCDGEGCECGAGPDDPCRDRCVTKIPCVGRKIKKALATKDCEKIFAAQVALTRARLAAEQYDIPLALKHYGCACGLLKGICSHDMQAELQNVAALIHIAKGEYLQAGWHLDNEAEQLRLAGIYREIPTALQLAAAAYEQAGRLDLAASRMCRVARIWYGRGEIQRSWRHVQSAVYFAEADGSQATKIRLALLANEIAETLASSGDPSSKKLAPKQTTLQDATLQDATRHESIEALPDPTPDSRSPKETPLLGPENDAGPIRSL